MLTFGGKVGIIAALLAALLTGCGDREASTKENNRVIQGAGAVVLSDGKSMKYTRNLRLGNGAEISSVVGGDTLKSSFVFEEPVRRLAVLSSAQIGYLLRLGAADCIVAVGEGRYIADTALYGRVARGEVAEIGYGNNMDFEKLMSRKPDYVMTFATGGAQDDYERLAALGLPAMLTSEWQEDSPLAKMEWIKLYGMMLDDGRNGLKALADSIFDYESTEYARVANGITDTCPRVLAGVSYGGVWYAPGGNSYTARLIKDAGGCYLWASDSTRELRLSLEEVMAAADSADLWINPGMFGSPEEVLAAEPRAAYIKAFKNRKVFQNDGRKGAGGGNDFFEGAVARPAEVLKNLRRCLFDTNCGVNQDSSSSWFHNIF